MTISEIYLQNPRLFDALDLPGNLVKDDAVQEILWQCDPLRLLYDEPTYLGLQIGLWSRINAERWQRIYNALTAEYNPIENYDKTETITETDTATISGSSESNGSNTSSGSNATTDKVAGFNEETFRNSESSEGSSNSTVTNKDSESSNSTEQHTHTHENKTHGNIGVTTSAQMIEGELEIRKHNLYSMLANDFKERFCVMIY